MNGAVTGLITTAGFRDEIEYRRGFKEDIWDARLAPPGQITPRRRRLTVPERILHDGTVHKPLDEAALREACRKLRLQNVEAVAISFLFSFVNPEHERRAKEIVRQEIQNAYVSASHEVLPRAPEYDRTSTTIVNAYVGPRVTGYLEKLVQRLLEGGYRNQLMVMQASGGVMTREYINGAPIRVLASGPAGGVIGSAHCGKAKGHPNLLCVDMGGTSYDMSLVIGGEAPAEAGWNMHHRYLIGVPMVKVETLGAGGGSICHVNAGALEVGPRSAGSEPGPICYGRGGREPTVTDALVMLGILSTDEGFAGGSFRLTRQGVDEAFQAIADGMGHGAADHGAEQAGFAADAVRVNYQLNMRYPGQNFSLSFAFKAGVPLGDLSFIDETFGGTAIELFNQRHMAEYDHIREHEVPEVSGVRLNAHVVTPSPAARGGFAPSGRVPAPAKSRRANLGGGCAQVPVYLGKDLEPGMEVPSPAIIEETFTTIVVYPGWKAQVDGAGDYQLVGT